MPLTVTQPPITKAKICKFFIFHVNPDFGCVRTKSNLEAASERLGNIQPHSQPNEAVPTAANSVRVNFHQRSDLFPDDFANLGRPSKKRKTVKLDPEFRLRERRLFSCFAFRIVED